MEINDEVFLGGDAVDVQYIKGKFCEQLSRVTAIANDDDYI